MLWLSLLYAYLTIHSHLLQVCLYSVRIVNELSQRTDKIVPIFYEANEQDSILKGYVDRLGSEDLELPGPEGTSSNFISCFSQIIRFSHGAISLTELEMVEGEKKVPRHIHDARVNTYVNSFLC